MKSHTDTRADMTGKLAARRKLLLALQCTLFLPLILLRMAPLAGMAPMPAWFAPAAALSALTCLFAMLAVAWRAGALRGHFIVTLAGVLLLALLVFGH